MIRLNAELRDGLAAEYVLGTQSTRVRRRMQRLLAQDSLLAERVAWWESQLNQLADSADSVPVPPWVWRRVENILQPPAKDTSGDVDGWWQSLWVWRGSTALATAMALVLLLLPPLIQRPDVITVDGGVVLVLTDEESKTAFLISRPSADAPIRAQAIAASVMTVQQAYELWLLPPDAAPLSLGLLNDHGGTILQPSAALSRLMQPGVVMAVSIEPPGGSPTGAPTGPVVYTGSILEL